VRALSIALKDTRHVYRNVAGLAMMLVAPMLLAFALGAAFGGGDNYSVATVKAALVDQDAGVGAGAPAAGAVLTTALTSPEVAGLIQVTRVDTPEQARALVDSGDADAAVLIPTGLSAALFAPTLGNPAANVEIYKDPSLTVAPAIVQAVVQSVVDSLNGARAAAGTSAQLGLAEGIDTARLAALAEATARAYSDSTQMDGQVSIAERAPEMAGANDQEPNVASQVLVGMMLFFMLFGAATPSRSILDEHREGTLSRLFTTPTPRGTILAGKYIAVFLVVLIQAFILVVAGRFLLGAHWGEIGPLAILILVSSLVAASLGLVTVSFAKTPAQAGAVSSAVFVFLGLVSGNFTGTASIGGAYAIVRRISPLGWLMEGWSDLLFGGSWESIALPVVVALGFTLVFLAIATVFFRRRYA
jgi:ABC-2 type transport system permease protein